MIFSCPCIMGGENPCNALIFTGESNLLGSIVFLLFLCGVPIKFDSYVRVVLVTFYHCSHCSRTALTALELLELLSHSLSLLINGSLCHAREVHG